MKGVPSIQISVSDIQSLYPWNGLSDSAIEFFVRLMFITIINPFIMMQSKHNRYNSAASSDIAVLGPNTYEGIKRYPKGDNEKLSQVLACVNGRNFDLKRPLILFPCRARYDIQSPP